MLTVALGVALLVLWLLLSGHYTTLLVALGVTSVCLVVWFAHRMRLIDREGVFIHLFPGLVGYWIWMMKEMFVSNVQAARIVLSPSLPISPALIYYRTSQQTELGRVLFGNSVTLTPGTVTTDVEGEDLRIHALAWVFVDGVEEGVMDARVSRLEGGSPEAFEPRRARVAHFHGEPPPSEGKG